MLSTSLPLVIEVLWISRLVCPILLLTITTLNKVTQLNGTKRDKLSGWFDFDIWSLEYMASTHYKISAAQEGGSMTGKQADWYARQRDR